MKNLIRIIILIVVSIGAAYSQSTGIDSSFIDSTRNYRGEDGKIYSVLSKNLEQVNTMSIFAWGEVLNKALTLFMGTDEENKSQELNLAKAQRILIKVSLKKVKVNKKVGRRLRQITRKFEKGKLSLFEYIWLKANLLGLSVNELEQIESKANTGKIYIKYIT